MWKDSLNDVSDPQSLKALEFERLLTLIAGFSVSQPGKEEVLSLRPLTQKDAVLYRQSLINDLRRLIHEGKTLPIEHFEELTPVFKAVKPSEAVLMPEDLLKIGPFLSSVVKTKDMGNLLNHGPLREYISHFHDYREVLTEIKRCINPDGSISDDASLNLREIRKRIRSLRKRIKNILERILQDPEKLPHIQDTYITERNGRYVIPVKTDHKGHIRGIIHDVSNTEATVFVEPQETVTLGNELENLIAEENIEIWRILRQISGLLRERLQSLTSDYDRLVHLDCLWAVARFSELAGMTIPEITDTPEIVIKQGRHPLLWNHLRENNSLDKLVPLDLELGRNFRCLIVTGSNAGGKTVSLKTVGLLTLMALCGMPVPAEEGTRFYLFNRVIADIGDEQSIEANLSTFSAHLLRMKYMLKEANSRSLILIDELGTGTDPEEGGALGASFLEGFLQRGALVMATTHLSFLKAFALKHRDMENAAMMVERVDLDGQTIIRPTYRLVIGQAGQSHALSIAEGLGIPEEVLSFARTLLRDRAGIVEEAMEEIAKLRASLEKGLAELERERQELEKTRHEMEKELELLRQKTKRQLERAREKALEFIETTRRKLQTYLEDLERTSKTEIKKRLRELSEEATRLRERLSEDKGPVPLGKLREGMIVRIGPDGPVGQVSKIQDRRVSVMVRGLQIETEPKNLYPAQAENIEVPETMRVPQKEESSIDQRIDLRGKTTDEAISELDRVLNKAVLDGISELTIIHGIGTGALRRAIREFLQAHPLVGSFRPGTKEEGSDGVTVVTLK